MLLISFAELQGPTEIYSSCRKLQILYDAFLILMLLVQEVYFCLPQDLNFWVKIVSLAKKKINP